MLKPVYLTPQIMGQSNIEMHVAHGCNLTCQSCSHYTNTGGGGLVDFQTAVDWMKPWAYRLAPRFFILMGGEPTLNKELPKITIAAAKLWAHSSVKIVTNGFFLHRHPELPSIMSDHGVWMEISIKGDSAEYKEKMEPVRKLVLDWQSRFTGLNIRFREDYGHWLKMYHGYGPNIMPFEDGDPTKSYQVCGAKICKVLHEGKLWKCPRLAFLGLHNNKFPLNEAWGPYLNYEALEPECGWNKLVSFFKEESISECAMCPATLNYMTLPSPLISVSELLRDTRQSQS